MSDDDNWEPPEYIRCIGGFMDGREIGVRRGTPNINFIRPQDLPSLLTKPEDIRNVSVTVTHEAYVRKLFRSDHGERWFLVWSGMSADDALKRVCEVW